MIDARRLFVIAAIVAADQLTKWIAVTNLSLGQTIPIIGSFCSLHLVQNRGIGFGITIPWMLPISLIGLALIFVLAILLDRDKALGNVGSYGIAILLGAGIGNSIDRIRLGYVIDFVDIWRWPVFNLADACLVAGIIIVAINYRRHAAGVKRALNSS